MSTRNTLSGGNPSVLSQLPPVKVALLPLEAHGIFIIRRAYIHNTSIEVLHLIIYGMFQGIYIL